MALKTAFIGFGEAGSTFASARGRSGDTDAYDRLINGRPDNAEMTARLARAGVAGKTSLAEAVAGATVIFSVVTADQALPVAADSAPLLGAESFFFDMNSVAPDTKRQAARAVGARYIDVAIMAPVQPAALDVPLLLSGLAAEAGAGVLRQFGFSNVRVVAGDVGRASAIKMVRSVMVKGVEALTAEMLLAGEAAGVSEEVLSSLGPDWPAKADYNIDRMLVHGARRAAEMREVEKTLVALGIEPMMTRGTIGRQEELGAIGRGSPPGLSAKLKLAA